MRSILARVYSWLDRRFRNGRDILDDMELNFRSLESKMYGEGLYLTRVTMQVSEDGFNEVLIDYHDPTGAERQPSFVGDGDTIYRGE